MLAADVERWREPHVRWLTEFGEHSMSEQDDIAGLVRAVRARVPMDAAQMLVKETPERIGAVLAADTDALYRRVTGSSRDVVDHFAKSLDTFFLVRLRKPLSNVLPYPFDLARVAIA